MLEETTTGRNSTTADEQTDAADPDASPGDLPPLPEHRDRTGTPPPPPRETEDPPRGKWDPDYDGRRDKVRAEDVIIWIPRTPLLPAYLVLNYGIRYPIVGAIAEAEEHKLPKRIEKFFRFADGKAGLFPVALYDRGRGLAAGAHFFYRDLGRKGHALRATVAYGTNRWEYARARDAWTLFDDESGELGFHATYLRDPTQAYTGLGPLTDIDVQAFFTEQKVEVGTDLGVELARMSRFSTTLSYKHARLLDEGREPDLGNSAFASNTATLTGFYDWFDLVTANFGFDIDTRRPEREASTGTGLRVESWGSYNIGVSSPTLSFFRYGTRPGVFWNVTGHNHVLGASVYAEALSEVGGVAPPLSELISLGGGDLMRGFIAGRFRGKSALVYTLSYAWPVFAYADVVLFGDVGSAFRGFFSDLAHEDMSTTFGAGLRSSFSRELVFQLLTAWGTNRIETWDTSFEVENFRLVAGVTRGF